MCIRDRGNTSEGRTAATNATVRTVFVVGPDKKIKLTLSYPMSTGRNFDEVLRVLDSIQLTAKHKAVSYTHLDVYKRQPCNRTVYAVKPLVGGATAERTPSCFLACARSQGLVFAALLSFSRRLDDNE